MDNREDIDDMPDITLNFTLPDDAFHTLQDDYKKVAAAWSPSDHSPAPSFEQWLASRMSPHATSPQIEDARVFTALEKLVTRLTPQGFGLAFMGKNGTSLPDAAREFSAHLVEELHLPLGQRKRIEELLGYYAKSAKEIADIAHVGVTNRAYGALHEACRDLVERTNTALDRLGEERAIGRAEGAIAMLVSLGVMDRNTGKEKTEQFKEQARHPGKR